MQPSSEETLEANDMEASGDEGTSSPRGRRGCIQGAPVCLALLSSYSRLSGSSPTSHKGGKAGERASLPRGALRLVSVCSHRHLRVFATEALPPRLPLLLPRGPARRQPAQGPEERAREQQQERGDAKHARFSSGAMRERAERPLAHRQAENTMMMMICSIEG